MTDTLVPIANSTRFNPHETSTATPAVGDFASDFWGEDGFTFDDVLDLVNPLQHLPFLSTLYREVTGDAISNAARIIGGGLFGGVAGMASGVVNAMFDEMTGGDIGEQVIALFGGDTPGADGQADGEPGGGDPSAVATAAARPAYGNEDRATYRTLLAAQHPPNGASEQRVAETGQYRVADAAPASPEAITYPGDKRAAVRLAMAATPADATVAAEPAANTASVAADAGNRETPGAPLWLTGMPAVTGDYTAITARYMAPAMADLLLKAVGHAPDGDGDARLRQAVALYEQSTAPETARDSIVDKLF